MLLRNQGPTQDVVHSAALTVIRPPLSFVYIMGFNGRDPDKDDSWNHLHVGAAPSASSTSPRPRLSESTRPSSRLRRARLQLCRARRSIPVGGQRSEPGVTSSDGWPLICLCPFSLNAMFDQRDASIPTGLFSTRHTVSVSYLHVHRTAATLVCNCCCYWCVAKNEGPIRVELTPPFGFRTHPVC